MTDKPDAKTCPRCGAEFTQELNEEECPGTVTYWACDSYLRSIYGEHQQSMRCKVASLTAQLAEAKRLAEDEHACVMEAQDDLQKEREARIQAEKERDEAKGELMLERVNWCQEALKTPEGQALVYSRARVAAACIGEESYTDSTGTIWDRPSAEVFFLTSNALIESNKARDAAKDKLAAAEQELAALKEAAQKVKAGSYLDDGVLFRHPYTTTSCEALRDLFIAAALLATPQGEERSDA